MGHNRNHESLQKLTCLRVSLDGRCNSKMLQMTDSLVAINGAFLDTSARSCIDGVVACIDSPVNFTAPPQNR